MDPGNKSKKNSEPKSGSNYLLLFIFLLVVSLIASMAVYNNAGFSISYKEFTDYLQKKEESEDKENFSFLVFREQGDRKIEPVLTVRAGEIYRPQDLAKELRTDRERALLMKRIVGRDFASLGWYPGGTA